MWLWKAVLYRSLCHNDKIYTMGKEARDGNLKIVIEKNEDIHDDSVCDDDLLAELAALQTNREKQLEADDSSKIFRE